MAVCSAHYEDPYLSEPEAPAFSLGERVVSNVGCESRSGTLRWIGRIPQLYRGWTVGVEFDEPVPNGGDGHFNRRRYFSSLSDHALFLPINDVAPVDSFNDYSQEITAVQHNMPPHVDCGGCHNWHPPRFRDSTYGYYRRNCYSSCSRRDYPCDRHCCERGPIYGRISSRQALEHREQPYESYFNCHVDEQECSRCRPVHYHHSPIRSSAHEDSYEDATRRLPQPSLKQSDSRMCTPSHDDRITVVDIPYKESFFTPRATIKLINGLKEWVTCWVLGTTRRKKKRSVLMKGRKTVTSLIVANGPHSMSKTGQRLSSFSEYSSVDSCTLPKGIRHRKTTTKGDSNAVEVSQEVEAPTQPKSTKAPVGMGKRRRPKKGPAPPPPKPTASPDAVNSVQNVRTTKRQNDTSTKHCSASLPSTSRKHQTAFALADANKASLRPKRSPKKRRAPLPPMTSSASHRPSEFHANFLRQAEQAGFLLNERGRHMFHITNSQQASLEIQSVNRKRVTQSLSDDDEDYNDWEIVSLPQDMQNGNSIISYGKLLDDIEYADNDKIRSETSNARATPIPSSEDTEGEEATVSPKYQEVPENLDKQFTGQYSKNDRRLKISIEKTEMNVVTVEEVRGNSDAEEQSSLSELSDEEEDEGGIYREPKALKKPEDSPSSAETRPIFDELRMTPPSKASVKDFVNAFNMLADRERCSDLNVRKNSDPSILLQKKTEPKTHSSKQSLENSIQSFPTKWQYQQSVPNRNHFLLPILEESHNDSSEAEGNGASKVAKSPSPRPSVLAKSINIRGELGRSEKAAKTGGVDAVQHKTRNSAVFSGKPAASDAALSSLLNTESSAGVSNSKGARMKRGTNKFEKERDDQPIVVSLYIEDKSSHRGPMPFIVAPSMSLRKLKKKVEKEYHLDKDLQCWILGETFAIHDEAPLSSYGVTDSGCPILLYVMSVDPKSKSLPRRPNVKARKVPIYDDVARSSTDSESEDVGSSLDRGVGRNLRRLPVGLEKVKESSWKDDGKVQKKSSSKRKAKSKSDVVATHAQEIETRKAKDYHALVQLDDVDLVTNVEMFECPICFVDIDPGCGALLQDCLHSFCKECLAGAIEYSETAVIKCPFRNDEYSCESHLQEREIKSLVSPEVFERHLQRSMALAERQAQDSFHCKTPDCPGWCLYEDNVNTFRCPVCKRTNCLTCNAIHEGRNCRQFQDDVASRCDSSEEAKKTKEYLEAMVRDGDAMKCPKCAVILMKKWGCDWLKCSMCHTEVCWVTKGPRWGPGGRGDTSGGCKCMLNGVRCHPKCSYCH